MHDDEAVPHDGLCPFVATRTTLPSPNALRGSQELRTALTAEPAMAGLPTSTPAWKPHNGRPEAVPMTQNRIAARAKVDLNHARMTV